MRKLNAFLLLLLIAVAGYLLTAPKHSLPRESSPREAVLLMNEDAAEQKKISDQVRSRLEKIDLEFSSPISKAADRETEEKQWTQLLKTDAKTWESFVACPWLIDANELFRNNILNPGDKLIPRAERDAFVSWLKEFQEISDLLYHTLANSRSNAAHNLIKSGKVNPLSEKAFLAGPNILIKKGSLTITKTPEEMLLESEALLAHRKTAGLKPAKAGGRQSSMEINPRDLRELALDMAARRSTSPYAMWVSKGKDGKGPYLVPPELLAGVDEDNLAQLIFTLETMNGAVINYASARGLIPGEAARIHARASKVLDKSYHHYFRQKK